MDQRRRKLYTAHMMGSQSSISPSLNRLSVLFARSVLSAWSHRQDLRNTRRKSMFYCDVRKLSLSQISPNTWKFVKVMGLSFNVTSVIKLLEHFMGLECTKLSSMNCLNQLSDWRLCMSCVYNRWNWRLLETQ